MTELPIHVTRHAYQRTKQRLGLKGNSARARIAAAWNDGIMGHEAHHELELWCIRKQRKNPNVTSIRIYQNHAFLFSQTTCLTVLEIPKELL